MESLRELFIEELKDVHNAEEQLVKALPKMAKAASNEELRSAFEEHLEQTRGHLERLEKVFENYGEKAKGKTCDGMKGLIEEGKQMMDEYATEAVKDAAIISAAQRVEHYEIAAYGTLRTWAKQLGDDDSAELLEETLNEEKEADEKLNEIAETVINQQAAGGEEREEGEEEGATVGAFSGSSSSRSSSQSRSSGSSRRR